MMDLGPTEMGGWYEGKELDSGLNLSLMSMR